VRIIILSGLSGSGKSVALHMLEDLGFYCIDNIPAALLKPFISYTVRSPEPTYERTAIGLDARNTAAEIATVPQLIDELRRSGIQCEVIFLVTSDEELLRAKNHLKGSLMLSLESTSSRMSNLARQELYFGRFYSLDEILASIEAVTHEELQSLARRYFQAGQIAVTVLGPLNGFTLDRSRLAC